VHQFHHAQLVSVPPAPEFYRIHALSHEMQTQAAGPDIVQGATTKLLGVYGCAAIFQDNFKGGFQHAVPRGLDAATTQLDRLFWLSLIGVANDVRQCFVHRQDHGTALGLGKT